MIGNDYLLNFPLTFNSSHNDFRTITNGGYVTDNNGYDIIFTGPDAITQLDHEIEKYNETTGEFVAHVRIPILYNDRTNILYIHFGNSEISTSQENITDVWDSDYIAIYHLNENVNDSTIYTNNGVDNGTSDVEGKIAHSRSCLQDYIAIDNVVDNFNTSQGTISVWFNMDSYVSDEYLWQFLSDDYNQIYARYYLESLRVGRITGTSSEFSTVATKYDSQSLISYLAELNGELYASTGMGGRLFKWNGVDTWTKVATYFYSQTTVPSILVHNGEIYGGTSPSGRLFKWNGVNAWTQVAPTLNGQTWIAELAELNGEIYAGTYPNGYLFKWNGTNAWTQVAGQLNSQTNISSLIVYNGKIYGGTYPNGCLFEWNGVNAWVQVAGQYGSETQIESLVIYKDELYGGTSPNGKLLKWNGLDAWEMMCTMANLQDTILSLCVHKEEIYAGTAPNAYLFKWSGGAQNWTVLGQTPIAQGTIHSLLSFNNKLYGGTYNGGLLVEYDTGVEDRFANINLTSFTNLKRLTLTWDTTSDEVVIYLDGVIQEIKTNVGSFIGVLNSSANIGSPSDDSQNWLHWYGDFDEVRISKIARSEGWEITEFDNQNSPSDFYILS